MNDSLQTDAAAAPSQPSSEIRQRRDEELRGGDENLDGDRAQNGPIRLLSEYS